MVARHILHVDLDAFFVAVEQARRPELQGKAVIVGGDPDGRGVVSTASYEARAFGVFSGQALRTAKRLAPHAIFLRGDFAEYSRVSGVFHAILRDFTPLVDPGGLDEAYLDVTGCEGLIGPPLQAAASIRARVRAETGLAASVGIASSRLVAKVASDRAKPDGVLDVPDGEGAAFLAPMPLRALPMLGPSIEAKLHNLGLATIGQLAALPDATLQGLFGPHGAVLGRRARGIDDTPVGGVDEGPRSISREGTFNEDVAAGNRLRSVLRSYSESVGSQLRAKGLRARTVGLKLRFGDFTTLSRSVTLRRPASSDDAIFAAACELLDKAWNGRPVRLIGVGVSNLGPDAQQLALQPGAAERQESLSAVIDQVRRKYGSRSLQTGRTAFRQAAADDDDVLERRTGLSSQLH